MLDLQETTIIRFKDCRRLMEAEQISKLRALVEAAEDVKVGRVYSWEMFKPRLARLRAKAKRIAIG